MCSRPFLPAYGVVAAADVVLAAGGRRRARRYTKPLLMPLLAGWVAGADGPEEDRRRLILAGLGLSGVGDIVLLAEGEAPLAAGLASFWPLTSVT